MKRQFWSLMVVTLAIVGCTKMCGIKRSGMTPEQVVEAYLQTALNMDSVSDRDILVDYTTGNLKNAIESATPETIKAAYVDRKYTLKSYSVVQRNDQHLAKLKLYFSLNILIMALKTPLTILHLRSPRKTRFQLLRRVERGIFATS